ncbi:HTTM domain-containing protein [Myxococcus sp. SDU36]|uniref:HTTM domain-containing protein n=1 Tax=Myxococcus sp. SDU36 TaxID=2831967 RepID=UPI00254278AB|nr:HTTM domain-containing protein [Myxococcus sp. SDU36]WIG98846.1 HTTM domain-containing protein [Myxococcus sp. SDU36]
MIRTATEGTIPPGSLIAFRILFGGALFVASVRFVARGWVDELYAAPPFRFHYPFFAWVPEPSREGLNALFAVMAVAALGVAAGALYRVCAAALFVSFTWLELLDVSTYLNHYYLLSLLSLLLVFMPLGSAGSVDAWLFPKRRRARLPAWCLNLLRFQVGCVYVFAGLAKLDADWLLHAQPLTIWLPGRSGLPVVGPLLETQLAAYLASWAGALFDLSVVPLLLLRRTRALAYTAVVAFHLVTGVLFPIGMFPWVMMISATLFFSPRWPARGARALGLPRLRGFLSGFGRTALQPAGRGALPRWGRALLAVWLLVQVGLPLRFVLYPGNTRWTEEGFRFAWRVMLIEKTGLVLYDVTEPSTGRRWTVSPREELTPLQVKALSTQPDLILQYAQVLARRYEAELGSPVEVRADAWASMNGRPAQRLIDPAVDLARQHDGFAPKRWILPLQTQTKTPTSAATAPAAAPCPPRG